MMYMSWRKPMASITINSAAIRLTDTILGYNEQDLEGTLKAIAADIGVSHISYLRLAPDKGSDTSVLTTAIVTYSRSWQLRYFERQYVLIDPVVAYGSKAVLPFDWEELASDDLAAQAFFADALNHDVGRNGISIPVRNRRGAFAVVSFTSNHSNEEWQEYKKKNMIKLQLMSVLIDFCREYQPQTEYSADKALETRRTVSYLGSAREDISGYFGDLKYIFRQREKLSRYGAA